MTDLRGSRARRIASIASLVFAAAATLATSASPPPPPALTSTTQGTLVVTRDEPVASIDVSVALNAAVLSAPGQNTQVRIQAGFNVEATSDLAATGRVVTIEPLDVDPNAGDRAVTAPAPSFQDHIDNACGPADCVRRYRITAVLVDPKVDEAKIDWSASAESRFGQGGATGSAPPDARLSVSGGEVATIKSDSVVRAETKTAPIAVDDDHPMATVTVDVVRPPDRAGASEGPLLVLGLPGDPALDPSQVLVSVVVNVGETQVVSGWVSSRPQVFAGRLPPGCADPAGCRELLTLTIKRSPRAPAASVAWLLRGIAIARDGAKPGALAFGAPAIDVLAFDRPDLTAGATGTATISAGKNVQLRATATLDQSAVPQGAQRDVGLVQATITLTSTRVAEPLARAKSDGVRIGDFSRRARREGRSGERARSSSFAAPGVRAARYVRRRAWASSPRSPIR